MSFSEKLKEFRKEKGLTQIELANIIGVAKSTYSLYESGKREPDVIKIKKIINALGITGDQLLQIGIKKTNEISSKALELAEKYDELDEHGKIIIDANLDIEYKRIQKMKENAPNIIKLNFKEEIAMMELPYLDLPASAGIGEYIDDYECGEIISVKKTDLTERTDFVVRVSGDSMEPKFYDGDRVLVKAQPTVEIGEIGIFYINSERYIKKQGNGCLISLNKKYPEIIPGEFDEVCCRGKVIGKL